MNTARTDLRRFAGPDALVHAASQSFIASTSQREKGTLTMAVPGGRIYQRFFEQLASDAQHATGALDRIHFFWGDERCVPPDHPDSNFALANEKLLKPLSISSDRIHRIHGEVPPNKAAELAETDLRQHLATPKGTPLLDYVFLGMGEDGHVASLFPGESSDRINSELAYRAVIGPKPPPQRVTLGYAVLWAARHVWVLVSGEEKTGALRQSLQPGGSTPLGRVLTRRSSTTIFTDCEVDLAKHLD